MKQLAQIQIAPQGGYTGFGILGNPGTNGIGILQTAISTSIGLMTVIAFIWFTYLFIIGAIGIMTAGGDKQKLQTSRDKIVNALIGIVVVILAVSVISLVGYIFGIPFLNLTVLFNQVTGAGGSAGGGGGTFKK
jgi:hypothetical protein